MNSLLLEQVQVFTNRLQVVLPVYYEWPAQDSVLLLQCFHLFLYPVP